jgi:Zn-dependent membrane protease YugP
LGVGSYVGMHGAYDIKNNSIYKFIATFKPLANIIYYISLFLIIAGMYTANETAYQVALLLLVLILIFSTIMFVCKRNIAYEAYDYLKNNKCFKKEEDDMLSTVLRNVYLESYTWLITDLFYPVINLITQRK